MFFTRRSLEQATDEQIAKYKAERFAGSSELADLCCGIGGDLCELAGHGRCVGIERDAIVALLAEANCRAAGLTDVRIEQQDVRELLDSLGTCRWHADPDRRHSKGRTSRLEFSEPGAEVWFALAARSASGAIKLAPAASCPPELADAAELEWIGSRRECRQQVVWLGQLAQNLGGRTATVIDRDGTPHSFCGRAGAVCGIASPASYVYDVEPTVSAARLAAALAESAGLSALSEATSYFTSDQLVDSPLLNAFEVEEALAMDLKRVKAALRRRSVGRLEIKVRGIDLHPEKLRRALRLKGDQSAVLLVSPVGRSVRALLARRC